MAELNFCLNCMTSLRSARGKCPACGKSVTVDNEPHQLPPQTILKARYLVGRVLGEGGFGITYIGFDLAQNSRVAIKEFFLSGNVSRTGSHTVTPLKAGEDAFNKSRDKFLDEANTLAQFHSDPNIVNIRDFFRENNTAYIVMEYLDGVDMTRYLAENGKLSFDELFALLEPVMHSLHEVHRKKLIHRDISPSNLMLTRDGTIKILDFGTAREQSLMGERSLSIVLKPGYAPEEQYRSRGSQGAWTDVYALCATIYKLISGVTPETATDRLFEDLLKPPSEHDAIISPQQEKVLMKGLAVRAEDRYQSMEALCAAFKGSADGSSVKKKKLPIPAAVGAAVAVLAVAALILFGGSAPKVDEPAEPTALPSQTPAVELSPSPSASIDGKTVDSVSTDVPADSEEEEESDSYWDTYRPSSGNSSGSGGSGNGDPLPEVDKPSTSLPDDRPAPQDPSDNDDTGTTDNNTGTTDGGSYWDSAVTAPDTGGSGSYWDNAGTDANTNTDTDTGSSGSGSYWDNYGTDTGSSGSGGSYWDNAGTGSSNSGGSYWDSAVTAPDTGGSGSYWDNAGTDTNTNTDTNTGNSGSSGATGDSSYCPPMPEVDAPSSSLPDDSPVVMPAPPVTVEVPASASDVSAGFAD